jgi:hypothetical protein
VTTITTLPSVFYESFFTNQTKISVAATFKQDINFAVKNLPVDIYSKNKMDKFIEMNLTNQQNSIINGEKAVRISAEENGNKSDFNYLYYFAVHDSEPYLFVFGGDKNNFQKYLPKFEQIVKSIKI